MTQLHEGNRFREEEDLAAVDCETRAMLLAIVRSLVDEPDQIELLHMAEGNEVTFRIRASPSDAGKVIGRKGRTAQAIRLILNGSGMRRGRIYTLDLAAQTKLI